MQPTRVCVIGAGPSGLTAAKALQDQGLDFDCFEKGSGIGGLWRYNNDSGLSAAYQSLHINTSRKRTQFADFPMPSHYPDFPHHSQMLEYFEKYVDHFGFRHHITFGATVQKVEMLGPDHWQVTWEDRRGMRRSRPYRAVMVANGHHWCPRYPEFAGEFHGKTMHAHDYRTSDGLQGQRVLVIGIGNSGCDIACESSRVAAATFLSTRRGAHVIPKYLFGKPLDRLCPPFVWRYAPRWLFKRLFGLALRIARGRPGRFGLPTPAHRVLEEHPTISSDLMNLLGHGRITIKPDIEKLDGDAVCFRDGSRVPIEVMIYATGYHIRFPFLDESLIAPQDNQVQLYKMVVHPDRAGLFFIGLVQPWGSIMPLAELQSRWISEVLAGKVGLPAADVMRRDIDRTHGAMRREYTASPRHTIQVDFYRYMAELNRERRRPAPPRPPQILSLPAQSPRRRAA